MVDAIELLETRRSPSILDFSDDALPKSTLEQILRIGARVPDHKKLVPWRYIVIEGEARKTWGQKFADIFAQTHKDASADLIQKESNRFLRSPVCVIVIYAPKPHEKVPEIEQILSTGALCQNILLGSAALGFGGVWLSGWAAFEPHIHQLLNLHEGEQIAAFLHLGKPKSGREDRERPHVESLTTWL